LIEMPTLTRAALAKRLALSESRVQQLTAENVLERVSGRYDLTASALALLRHQRSDSESRQMRMRYQASQAKATELRVQRQLKRLVHVDEIGWLFTLFLEGAHKAAAGVAARIYAEASMKLPEFDARLLAGLSDQHLRGLIRAFRLTIDQTLQMVRDEKLPSDQRIDLIARSLVPGNQAIVATYLEKFTAEALHDEAKNKGHIPADEAAAGPEASARPRRTRARVGSRARRAPGDATSKTDGD
jgi:hypothetical protein